VPSRSSDAQLIRNGQNNDIAAPATVPAAIIVHISAMLPVRFFDRIKYTTTLIVKADAKIMAVAVRVAFLGLCSPIATPAISKQTIYPNILVAMA
jgi:hypothetical protein